MGYTILITGATGYLGSVLCADLCRDHEVVGLFIRPPGRRLIAAAPGVRWEMGDVVETGCLECVFRRAAQRNRPIDYVIHFAAYTDYGEKWQDEYTDTNVLGTRNIVDISADFGVRRILFAGSIASLDPGPFGSVLTEKSSHYGEIAYSKSKAMGEQLLLEHSGRTPVVVLRLGGVFTHWCELPPLFSVINLWSRPFIGRIMPGRGNSGFPYIHRQDVVSIVRRILEKNENLARFEVLFGSSAGATLHREIFPIIRQACNRRFSTTPVNVSGGPAKAVLRARYLFNTLIGKKTYERAWMIDYADRPLVVDTTYTQKTLGWQPDSKRHVLNQLPGLMENFKHYHRDWVTRNINRNDQKYDYYPD